MNAPSPPVSPVPAKKSGLPTWAIVLVALGAVFFLVVPIVSVLAIYGIRKYIANAKSAEARNTVVEVAKRAVASYDPTHGFCASASHAVPAATSMIHGKKYQSVADDWSADAGRNAGFACLGFSMDLAQYYQYDYRATKGPRGTFEVIAHGDLNGDGKESTFRLTGSAASGVPVVAPAIEETDPFE